MLGESRARFEEQSPRRQRDDDMDEDEGDEDMAEAEPRAESADRDERQDRRERQERARAAHDRGDRERTARQPRRGATTGTNESAQRSNGGETIPLDVLPPAIGRDEPAARRRAEEPRASRAAVPAPRVRPTATTRSRRRLKPPSVDRSTGPRSMVRVQRDEGEQAFGHLDLGRAEVAVRR